jgi:hypothetical protein
MRVNCWRSKPGPRSVAQANGLRGGDMQMIHGKVRELLFSSANGLYGFVTDGGAEVHFAGGKSDLVRAVLSVGSSVEILGCPCDSTSTAWLEAYWIGNLDRGNCVDLSKAPFPREPEISFAELSAPQETTSLAPPSLATGLTGGESRRNVPRSELDRDRACESVGSAFDALHRAQALVAYIKILGRQGPSSSDLLDEAKRAYRQALTHYSHQEYPIAFEYALASCELSFTVETGVTRALASDLTLPTLVPSPPIRPAWKNGAMHASRALRAGSSLLLRLRWVLENGTLAAEDREQVRRLVSRAEGFYEEAVRYQEAGQWHLAMGSAREGGATARSAEHICRQAYLFHGSGSALAKRSVA